MEDSASFVLEVDGVNPNSVIYTCLYYLLHKIGATSPELLYSKLVTLR